MRNLFILLIGFVPQLALCDSAHCEKAKVLVIGKYKDQLEVDSPLLDMWSEASGNLISLEVKSTKKYNQLKIDFEDEDHKPFITKEWPLVSNKLVNFDLIKELAIEKKRAKFLTVKVFDQKKEYCHLNVEVIQKDADGVSDKQMENKK